MLKIPTSYFLALGGRILPPGAFLFQGVIMHQCPICGCEIVVDPDTGCLMVHGPEDNTTLFSAFICSGSGTQVEEPKDETEQPM